jgi:putative transposase
VFARSLRPELIHIRTRRKPQQNGVRERAFGSLKYEHLYGLEIDDGYQLGQEVEPLPATLQPDPTAPGTRRATPLDVHLEACQHAQTTESNEPKTLPLS